MSRGYYQYLPKWITWSWDAHQGYRGTHSRIQKEASKNGWCPCCSGTCLPNGAYVVSFDGKSWADPAFDGWLGMQSLRRKVN